MRDLWTVPAVVRCRFWFPEHAPPTSSTAATLLSRTQPAEQCTHWPVKFTNIARAITLLQRNSWILYGISNFKQQLTNWKYFKCCFYLGHRAFVKGFISLQFLNFSRQDPLGEGSALHKAATYPQTQNKRRRTSMPWEGFEPHKHRINADKHQCLGPLYMCMHVFYLYCHEAGLCCYLVIHIGNLFRPLQLF
jgi:hypothetical protein